MQIAVWEFGRILYYSTWS